MTARRGTTNGNERGNWQTRRRRREWLVVTWRADVDVLVAGPHIFTVRLDAPERHPDTQMACRCYRCGTLLTVDTVTVDRIVPGCQGGTYARHNIRPACGTCNSITGGAVRRSPTSQKETDVPSISRRKNARQNARYTNGRAVPDMTVRKTQPCAECGAVPGGSCYTLVSVRQVREGREGAYLKPITKLHASRGVS